MDFIKIAEVQKVYDKLDDHEKLCFFIYTILRDAELMANAFDDLKDSIEKNRKAESG